MTNEEHKLSVRIALIKQMEGRDEEERQIIIAMFDRYEAQSTLKRLLTWPMYRFERMLSLRRREHINNRISILSL